MRGRESWVSSSDLELLAAVGVQGCGYSCGCRMVDRQEGAGMAVQTETSHRGGT